MGLFCYYCFVLCFFSAAEMSMSCWIVLLLGSPIYCTCWALCWVKMCHVEDTTWQLIMILSMLIHGPGDDLFLCGASALAGPMMTNYFQSLWRGPCKCYTILPDWWCKFMYVVHWYLWPVFVMFFLLCFLEVILYFIEVYFDIIVFLTSLFVSWFFSIFFHQSHPFATCFYGELYSDINYCSSLARVVIDTYVVPRHWRGQWWPVVLSSDRASVTNYFTIWTCRCSEM